MSRLFLDGLSVATYHDVNIKGTRMYRCYDTLSSSGSRHLGRYQSSGKSLVGFTNLHLLDN